jgi:thioredoxin reductase
MDTNEDPYDVDLAVIGSGGAAMAAAIATRQAGKTAVLIERGILGGTCVNIGCVPSKTLLAAAGARHGALTNPFGGAPTSADGVDFGALVEQKDELIARLRGAKYADVADAYGFEVRPGQASFLDEQTLAVDGEPLRARAYLIATGSTPLRPDLPGLDQVDWLTSTTAMELDKLPESLVVIGGGYVGMEQAQLFAHLGSQVTVVGRLAPQAQPELAERCARSSPRTGSPSSRSTPSRSRPMATTRWSWSPSPASGPEVPGSWWPPDDSRAPTAWTCPPPGWPPTSGASSPSMAPSAPPTRTSTPPGTSPAHRSTSTSPRPADASRP